MNRKMTGGEMTMSHLTSLALGAGKIMRRKFQLGMTPEWKDDETLITDTDKAINRMVIEHIENLFGNNVRAIGEEGPGTKVDATWTVVFDPVDGTTGFSKGIPVFCFCICLQYLGRPKLACVFDPMLNRLYTAEEGGGAWMNGKKLSVSKKDSLPRAHIGVALWKGCDFNMHAIRDELSDIGTKTLEPISIGYYGALLAAGELDATLFPASTPWETGAIKLLVEEAGGRVTDVYGNEQERYDGDIRGHLASNGLLHDELSAITRKANAL